MQRNIVIILLTITGLITSIVYESRVLSNTLTITVCDVGQGDASIIRTPDGHIILIDGGPGDAVLSCLENHMPFWERTIDMLVLTHPDLDHFEGLMSVLNRYTVVSLLEEDLENVTPEYHAFRELVKKEKLEHFVVERGTTFSFSENIVLSVLAPDKTFLEQENPTGERSNENPPSLILHLKFKQFDALFPGDSDGEDIVRFVQSEFKPEFMVVPHHGSKNGYTENAARIVAPRIAIASLGEKNRYGHPAAEVVDRLKKSGASVYRTDHHGEVTIETKGQEYWIKSCEQCP
jgi:competence protein ComEC